VEQIETIIVGGGQAGLAMSYWLSQAGREHVVLERGRVVERWQSQRWDSLCLLTPNWTVSLPAYDYDGPDPDGFMGRDAVVGILTDYAERIAAPIRTGIEVQRLERPAGRDAYVLSTTAGQYLARNVVIATGPFGIPMVPAASETLSPETVQVHSSAYRNPGQLPPGATLVVGAGASGFQIAEDLLEAGRRVYFSLGRHEARLRRYRGQDIAWWMAQTGQWDRTLADNPAAFYAPRASLTGAGGGHDLSVRKLAQEGATLLGRLQGAHGVELMIAPDIGETVQEGDERSRRSLAMIDEFIARHGIAAPAHEPVTWPDPPELADPILQLDLRAAGVTSVVWATGFRYAFDWIQLAVFDARGNPEHTRGVTAEPGLYFLGLRWLYKFKSSFIHGVGEDAEFLAEQIVARDTPAQASTLAQANHD
jgi:putative flavoprotein involved in K+ transport